MNNKETIVINLWKKTSKNTGKEYFNGSFILKNQKYWISAFDNTDAYGLMINKDGGEYGQSYKSKLNLRKSKSGTEYFGGKVIIEDALFWGSLFIVSNKPSPKSPDINIRLVSFEDTNEVNSPVDEEVYEDFSDYENTHSEVDIEEF